MPILIGRTATAEPATESAPPPRGAASTPSTSETVSLESLIERRGGEAIVERTGQWHTLTPDKPAVLEGEPFSRAILIHEIGQKPGSEATLSLRLNGGYERFTATLGRDDTDAETGPGYVVFEVWGDGKLLFHSPGIRSSHFPVALTGNRSNARRAPQSIDVPISGVRVLRLVTRFASELAQAIPPDQPVRGSVWAVPLLYAAGARSGSSGPSQSVETREKPGKEDKSPRTDNRPKTGDLRTTLRAMAVRLGAQAIAAQADAATPQEPPFTAYLTPVAVVKPEKPGREAPLPVALQDVHSLVEELLLGVRYGNASVFASAPKRVSAPRTARPNDDEKWRDTARRAKAYLTVLPLLTPPATGASGEAAGWNLDIRLLETESGRVQGDVRAFLPGGR